MQEMEMSDHNNEPPRDMKKCSGVSVGFVERRFSCQLIVLGFGLLCSALVTFTCCSRLTQSSQLCPPGWTEIQSRCYFLSTEHKSWEDSRNYCQSNGADLVVINSEEEQRAIYRLDEDGWLLFWIGLKGTNGAFRWVDGSALTKPFWKVGQPDHGGPNNVEDCVEMYHHDPALANWNDAPCGHGRRWLCEKDPK
ncbi:CD209 antigen-like isoform X2 [Stegastes partitus]|uniref:CD209 antigen-like isoform X2 n=1 Tax=Stegastes partitus TaxID=144197 RepID=A0A9Y4K845_9TELE|nr:PREDICTED: CD209 antigen-like isoform X2 [Stegastes partitus]